MSSIKCPQCGGNQFKNLGDTYKCLYCGTSFQPVQEEVRQPTIANSASSPGVSNTPSNVNVTVNVADGGTNRGSNNGNTTDSFARGAAGGAGIVAGGCLTASAIYLAGPIVLFLLLLSMCS